MSSAKRSKKKSSYTKSQLASDLAEKADLPKSKVSDVLTLLQDVAVAQLKATGSFTIPGLVKMVVKTKKATAASTRTMFGREMRIAAKPSRRVVRGRILKAVKDAV